jgi:hypothetical protein
MLPAPIQRRTQPYLFTLAMLLGALLAWRIGRIGLGLGAAALLSFALLSAFPLEAPLLGYPGLSHELAAAPFWTGAVALVARVERYLSAIVAAVVVFCALLIYFDHRGSGESDGGLSAPRALFDAFGLSLCTVALIESGTRSSWLVAFGGAWGAAGGLALIGACVVAFIGARKRRAET